MSIRMNVGFKHSEIIERIVYEAEEQKISKSQFIENTVTAYFKHHKNDRVKLGIGRKTQRSHRLQVVFKNEELVALIKNHSKKYAISKSKIIEYILGKYLDMKNNEIEKNNKTRQNFNSNIFNHTIFCEDEFRRRRYKELDFDAKKLDIEIRSLSLANLNKTYLKEIKNILLFNPELNSKRIEANDFCYIILVKEARLRRQDLILPKKDEDKNKDKDKDKDKDNQINKNRYVYRFEINYIILKIAKIIRDTNKNKDQLKMLLLYNEKIVERPRIQVRSATLSRLS